MHSSWCSCDTVRQRTRWNNFSFAVHLPNIPQTCSIKWLPSLANISFRGLTAHLFCRCCFRHDKNQKCFMHSWKRKTKIFRYLLSSSPRKNQTAKKFKQIWQFFNRFHLLSVTSKVVHYAFVNLVLCVARWGQNTVGVCFIWTSVGSWGKVLERVAHAMTPVRH